MQDYPLRCVPQVQISMHVKITFNIQIDHIGRQTGTAPQNMSPRIMIQDEYNVNDFMQTSCNIQAACVCKQWLRPHLLRRAVCGIQNGLVRNVVGAAAQVGTCAQVDELEALLVFSKDDVHGLYIPVH